MNRDATPEDWVYSVESTITHTMECMLQAWNIASSPTKAKCLLKPVPLFHINSQIKCKYGISSMLDWKAVSLYSESTHEEAVKSKPSLLSHIFAFTIYANSSPEESWVYKIERKHPIK